MAGGQSGQIELQLDTICGIKVPVPPLQEQRKIVSEIEKLESEVMQAEIRVKEIKAEKEAVLNKDLGFS